MSVLVHFHLYVAGVVVAVQREKLLLALLIPSEGCLSLGGQHEPVFCGRRGGRRRGAAGDGPGELNGLRGAEALAKIRFKLPGWNWTPYVIIAFLAMVAVLMCFSPSYRIALIAGVIWLAVLFAAYAITSRASAKRDAKTVLDSTRK